MVTKRRNADSVLINEDHSLFFIRPFERNEIFSDFIAYIQEQEKSGQEGPVKYGQTRKSKCKLRLSRQRLEMYQSLF